ncbi:glycosyltransferase family 4 protein [Patescibacteria group bacterium]|nr:glycosyltransferase family 4 protein [Patescibacteria group bacterium]
MKILYITDIFPPYSSGGADNVAFILAKKMMQLGYEIYVISTVQDKNEEKEIEYEGLKIHQIYTDYDLKVRNYVAVYNPETVKKVRQIVRKIKPDVVHFHIVHLYLSYACFKVAKKYSKKVFLTAHDMMLVHHDKFREYVQANDKSDSPKLNYKISSWQLFRSAKKRFNPLRRILIKHYLKYIDKIFCVSHELEKALNANNIKNTVTIHNGIEAVTNHDQSQIEDFKNKYNLQGKKVIFYAGRLSGSKGGAVIVKSLSLVKQKVNNAVLLIAGEKSGYANIISNLAEQLEVSKNIEFTGWLQKNDMSIAYSSCDVVVVPSLYLDPFPTVNLEAMVNSKPVVGTIFGGTKEAVVDQETGYIVNPNNVEKFADKIVDILSNNELAAKMGEAGKKRVEEVFTLNNQAKKILEWYNKNNA